MKAMLHRESAVRHPFRHMVMGKWDRTIWFLLWFSIRVHVSLTAWVISCSHMGVMHLAVAAVEHRVSEVADKRALQIAVVLSVVK